MKEVCNHSAAGCFVLYVVERSCWEVAEENVGALRWFPAEFLWDVTNCHIDQVC